MSRGTDWLGRIGTDHVLAALNLIRLGLNVPHTSSMGRVFDGVASIAGISNTMRYEGQAALMLEMAMVAHPPEVSDYTFGIEEKEDMLVFNPDSLMLSALQDAERGRPAMEISGHAHAAIVNLWVNASRLLRKQTGLATVALSGGCFMNRFLLEKMSEKLSADGFTVLTHCHVPANDGGLSLGQAVVGAARRVENR